MKSTFTGPAPANGVCPISTTGTDFVLFSPATGTPGGSTYQLQGNTYHFNWDTSTGAPTGQGCYTLSLQFNDTVVKQTSVRLK